MPEPVVAQPPVAAAPAPAVTPSPSPPPNPDPKAAATPPAPKSSIYADAGLDEPGAKGSATWPDDWREQFAGDNKEAASKVLSRFDSPAALAKSYFALQQKISSGEFKKSSPAPEGATEEVLTKWREDNGLPAKAEAYDILPKGATLDSLDVAGKATLAKFQDGFLKGNLTQGQAKEVSNVIYEMAQSQMAERAQADATFGDASEDTLRSDWGPEYRSNIQMNLNHLNKTFGEALSDQMLGARLPDGKLLSDTPEFSKAINAWARSEGGDILYDGGSSGAKTVDGRIAEIETIMNNDFSKYTPALKTELRTLLEKRENRGAK